MKNNDLEQKKNEKKGSRGKIEKFRSFLKQKSRRAN